MINKKYMNYIKKEVKKEKSIIIKYFPTDEEKEYLKTFNIEMQIVIIKQKSLITDYHYDTEYCKYTLIS